MIHGVLRELFLNIFKNFVFSLCVLAFSYVFSSYARASDSSTEAGALCIDGDLCAGGGSSSLSRLAETLPEDSCPKFIIKQQILRDKKGSLTADSPDEICSSSTANSLNHFSYLTKLYSFSIY